MGVDGTSHLLAESELTRMPTKFEPFDWYETPLYYDIIFDEDTDREADFLDYVYGEYVEATRRKGQPIRMLEPACGSGRLLCEMASRDMDCTGFDLSDGMLRFAHKRMVDRNVKAKAVNADMADFSFKQKFDLAYCGVSTFKYLLTESDARSHLQCIAEALKPGGVYVLGFHISDDDHRSIQRERWVAKRGKTNVTCNIQSWPVDRKTRTEQVRSRLVVEENGATKRYETTWQFRTYSAKQVESLLRSVPELEHLNTYDMTYDPKTARDDIDERYDCVLILQRR